MVAKNELIDIPVCQKIRMSSVETLYLLKILCFFCAIYFLIFYCINRKQFFTKGVIPMS